jgi:hypothetical protein
MSGDPEQEYFADGMVEEIITALSRIRWLFVIARNSSFTYKGQAVDVRRVGSELERAKVAKFDEFPCDRRGLTNDALLTETELYLPAPNSRPAPTPT